MKSDRKLFIVNTSTVIIFLTVLSALTICWVCIVSGQSENVKVVSPNQGTFAWDAVMESGIDPNVPIRLAYEVFLAKGGINEGQDRQDVNLYLSLGIAESTMYMVTFPDQNIYLVGVRTLKYIADSTTPLISTISWCDDPSVAHEPWQWLYIIGPDNPKGLRISN